MQQLFESWRKYLLNEVSFADAKEILNSKGTLKIIKNYEYEMKERYGRYRPQDSTAYYHKQFKDWLLEAVPDDLTDNQKGTAVLWLRKLAKEDFLVAKAFIDADTSRRTTKYGRLWTDFEAFFHHQRFMPQQDLMSVKTIDDLQRMVDAAKDDIRAAQEKKQYLDAEEGTEVLKEDEYLFIAALHNKGAACELGKGTDWCTAAPGLDYFSDYYEPDDPLFFFKHYGDRYQFHYGSQQFMDDQDRSIEDTNPDLFKYLHKKLAGTEAIEKYPQLRSYHYNLISSDSDTSPEELDDMVEEYLEHADTELSTELVTWEAQILNKVAKNASASLETLKKLYNATNNNFITRNIQNNPVLGTSKEGIELAKEIFIKSHRDEYVYDRGLKLLSGFVRDGLMSKEEFHDALSKSPKAAEFGFRRVAERALREHKITMRVKNS
jgi:hypothetical protein